MTQACQRSVKWRTVEEKSHSQRHCSSWLIPNPCSPLKVSMWHRSVGTEANLQSWTQKQHTGWTPHYLIAINLKTRNTPNWAWASKRTALYHATDNAYRHVPIGRRFVSLDDELSFKYKGKKFSRQQFLDDGAVTVSFLLFSKPI